jgi:MFS family permease
MWLANRVGRRVSLIIASILVFIGVALQAGASGYIASLYVGRFIAGVAIGIASSVNPLYVSENAPRGIRGLLTGFYQLSIVTGLTVSVILSRDRSSSTVTDICLARLLDQLWLYLAHRGACSVYHPSFITSTSCHYPLYWYAFRERVS